MGIWRQCSDVVVGCDGGSHAWTRPRPMLLTQGLSGICGDVTCNDRMLLVVHVLVAMHGLPLVAKLVAVMYSPPALYYVGRCIAQKAMIGRRWWHMCCQQWVTPPAFHLVG